MTDTNKLRELLLELPEIKSAEHIKSMESAATNQWGEVIWSEEMIARDALQNFVDGCVESKIDVNKIKISTDNDQIKVYAPNEYELEKLFYIGSNKQEMECLQIGANGEGSVKMVADLSRMGIFNPIFISGDKALVISLGKEIPKVSLRALTYNYFKINKLKGNYFILNTISKKLKNSFKVGLKNFFFSNNPILGEVIYSYNNITVYKSNEKDGFGFYKNLKRVDIKDIPIVISIEKPYAALDRRVRGDRDRL